MSRVRPDIVDEPVDVDGRGGSLGDGARGVWCFQGAAATGRSTAPPSVDVSGKWAGTWVFRNPSMGSGDVLVDLKQSGAKTTGHLTVTGDTTADPTYFEGIVSGSTIILNVPYLSGTLDVRGER
jgi:hypothetical protein